MLSVLVALSMAAAADAGASTDDKTIHACPAGWEVGFANGWEVGGEHGWEVGDTCTDLDGYAWRFDGYTWQGYPDVYGNDGYTW